MGQPLSRYSSATLHQLGASEMFTSFEMNSDLISSASDSGGAGGLGVVQLTLSIVDVVINPGEYHLVFLHVSVNGLGFTEGFFLLEILQKLRDYHVCIKPLTV